MQRIKFMYKQFLREPLWFRLFISTTLLISIIFSSSIFTNGYYKSYAKLAAAIFFCAYGINMRRNVRISILFFALALVCIFLSYNNFKLAN
ncbi:hypothetical protein D7Z26_00795 [Cohnella endophytica]|uniref:Uncharacterized protein n=1 Tax=Cohnella endophytica TaxID=2419778 RepID=A0A494YBN6_9BACL|nr:hypothetical protein D7Z26_00795 [Cohnella endophytica]